MSDMCLNRLTSRSRRRISPQLVHDAIGRDGLSGMDDEYGEEGAALPTSQIDRMLSLKDLEGSEEPPLHRRTLRSGDTFGGLYLPTGSRPTACSQPGPGTVAGTRNGEKMTKPGLGLMLLLLVVLALTVLALDVPADRGSSGAATVIDCTYENPELKAYVDRIPSCQA